MKGSPGGGTSKNLPPLVKTQKYSRRAVTRAQAAALSPNDTSNSASQDQRKRKRTNGDNDDDDHSDLMQVKLESVGLQKNSNVVADPTKKRKTSVNNAPPQLTIGFKKIKPGLPRKAAPGKDKTAFATTKVLSESKQIVCELCEEVGHDIPECE